VNAGPPPPRNEGPSRFRNSPRGGGGDFSDSENKVHVSNLAWGVDNGTLESFFGEHGKVLEARVIYDRDSGRSRGFGFVTYSSPEEVSSAIESLDGVVSKYLCHAQKCFVNLYSSMSTRFHLNNSSSVDPFLIGPSSVTCLNPIGCRT